MSIINLDLQEFFTFKTLCQLKREKFIILQTKPDMVSVKCSTDFINKYGYED